MRRGGSADDRFIERGFGAGFTVLEIVVALTIVSILLALAVPGYQRYIQRADRAEAIRALLAAAACQERIRAVNGLYDTHRCLENQPAEAYALRFEPADDEASLAFTVFAEPIRTRNRDTCGTLSLDQTGTRAATGTAGPGACWGGR